MSLSMSRSAYSFRLPLWAGLSLGLFYCGGPSASDPSLNAGRAGLSTALDPANTVTVHVHGWDLSGASMKGGVVGDDRGAGGAGDGIRLFSGLPDGTVDPTAPNQLVATEYYGTLYPSYYTSTDIAEVSAVQGVPRYALIVAKYANHVLARSGATGVNLTCHSMGCLISRYIIENDTEQLVSAGKLRRWATFSGVVDGAILTQLDHGEWLDPLAKLLGINLIDVDEMTYDWVTANVAVYDHDRPDGNNPNFGGILIHHILGTDSKISTAYSIPLLDVLGYGNVPNDGIVLDDEMYLHAQQPSARFPTPSGELLAVSRSHVFADHFTVTDAVPAQALAAAALVGSRRVKVTLHSLSLLKEHDKPPFASPPDEVVVESTVQYPYLTPMAPSNPLLDEVSMARRNAPVVSIGVGTTLTPDVVVYEGPVFDAQTSVLLNVNLLETDWYPAGNVNEDALSANAALGSFTQEVPLSAGDYTVSTADVAFTLHVEIEPLY